MNTYLSGTHYKRRQNGETNAQNAPEVGVRYAVFAGAVGNVRAREGRAFAV